MQLSLFLLTEVERPCPILSPGRYLATDGEEHLHITLHHPMPTRALAQLIRESPGARSVAA